MKTVSNHTTPPGHSGETRAESARAPAAGIPCAGCGDPFTPRRPGQRHCSPRCRAAASRTKAAAVHHAAMDRLRSENARLRAELQKLQDPSRGLPSESRPAPSLGLERLVVYADGSCEPNPGQAQCGVAVFDDAGVLVRRVSKALGRGTSNTAEWSALIEALRCALGESRCRELTVRMDSRLVVEQVNGRWRIKDGRLRRYAATAAALTKTLKAQGCSVRVAWVPREQNHVADALSRGPAVQSSASPRLDEAAS